MMKAVLTVAALMMLSPCLAQEVRQPQSSQSLRVQCDTLFNNFVKASTDYADGTHKAKTPDEARKYSPPDGPDYAARFMSMAKAHPDDPVAEDALVQAILVDFYGSNWKEAIEQIRARYLKSPRIGAALRVIAHDTTPPEVESLLREVLRGNPSAEVRAQAAVALAEHLERLIGEAENMRDHPDRFEHAVARFGRDYVARMRDRDTAMMRQEVESLLESVIREYSRVPSPRLDSRDRPSPAEVAKGELRSLRELSVGKPAPEIEGKDVDGRPMRLSDYRGKVVVLNFWATWCGPCLSMVPHERELVRRMEGKPFVLLGVNADEDKERLRYQSKELRINWRSFYDGGPYGPISRSWNVQGWPMVVVLDRNGVIRYKGGRDEKKLDEAVEELLKSGS
jgi:thiol-disulfide isomerase/thioredoxin